MQMQKISAGRLRAIGYDANRRILRVEFDDGHVVEHAPVGAEMWRRFSTAASAWSYYRDVIEEEIPGRRVSGAIEKSGKNPLDDLFK